MKVRVEFGLTPVIHIAVQCDSCNNWFNGRDITSSDIDDEVDIEYATFECPVCGHTFGYDTLSRHKQNIELTECKSRDEVYLGCLYKKETWE